MLRVGIAGLGAISGTHIEAIEKMADAKIVAVCDRDEEKSKKLPAVTFYHEIEMMLEQQELDCLHICLPHHHHVPAALKAAQKGISVLLEKPAGLNSRDWKPLIGAEAQYGMKLGLCLQNRYNRTTQAVLKILKQQEYGKLKGCKAVVTWNRTANYYDKDPWRGKLSQAGGGVMLSQSIHTIDLLCLFCGKAEWVKGFAGNLLLEEIEVEDTACAHIHFKNGISSIFYGSVTHCTNSSIELEIVCEDAVLLIKNNELRLLRNHQEMLLERDVLKPGQKDYYGSSHDVAIRNFYNELLYGNGSYVNLNQAAEVSYIIDAIMESARGQCRVYI